MCERLSVCLSVCVRTMDWWELNANSSKTVKATDFKFDRAMEKFTITSQM